MAGQCDGRLGLSSAVLTLWRALHSSGRGLRLLVRSLQPIP